MGILQSKALEDRRRMIKIAISLSLAVLAAGEPDADAWYRPYGYSDWVWSRPGYFNHHHNYLYQSYGKREAEPEAKPEADAEAYYAPYYFSNNNFKTGSEHQRYNGKSLLQSFGSRFRQNNFANRNKYFQQHFINGNQYEDNQNQNNFGNQQAFGENQNNFGYQQSNFGQSHLFGNSNFRGNQNTFGNQQSNFGRNQNTFGNQQSNFRENENNFGNQQSNFGRNQNNFGNQQNNFRENQNNLIETQQSNFRSNIIEYLNNFRSKQN